MNTPKIVTEWLTWYRDLPRWQRYVPLAVIALLWLALVLR